MKYLVWTRSSMLNSLRTETTKDPSFICLNAKKNNMAAPIPNNSKRINFVGIRHRSVDCFKQVCPYLWSKYLPLRDVSFPLTAYRKSKYCDYHVAYPPEIFALSLTTKSRAHLFDHFLKTTFSSRILKNQTAISGEHLIRRLKRRTNLSWLG